MQQNILYRLKSESFALWIWLECFNKECTKKPPCFCTKFRLFCFWFWNRSKNKLLFCSLTLTIQRQIQIQERILKKPASAYLTIVWLQYTKQNSNGMKPHIWNAMRQCFWYFLQICWTASSQRQGSALHLCPRNVVILRYKSVKLMYFFKKSSSLLRGMVHTTAVQTTCTS